MSKNKRRFTESTFQIGGAYIDPALCIVRAENGSVSEVSRRQILAIAELAKRYGSVVSRAKMHKLLCLTEEGLRDKGALSHHIGIIRKAMGDSAQTPRYIKTIRGQGYFLMQKPNEVMHHTSFANTRHATDVLRLWGSKKTRNTGFWLKPTMFIVLSVSLLLFAQSQFLREAKPLSALAKAAQPQFDEHSLTQAISKGRAFIDPGVRPNAADEDKIRELKQQYLTLLEDQTIPERAKAESLLHIGKKLTYLKELKTSSLALGDSLAIQRKADFSSPILQASTLTSIAQLNALAKQNIDDSRELLVKAASIMRQQANAKTELIMMLLEHSVLYNFAENPADAESLLREALHIANNYPEKNTSLIFSILIGLAHTQTLQSKFSESEFLLNQLLNSNKANHHNLDGRLVRVFTERGFLFDSMRRFQESSIEYENALNIFTNYYPENHSRVLLAKLNLANALLNAGNTERSIGLYSDLIRTDIKRKPLNILRLGNLKLRLSNALLDARKPKLAYREVEQVIAMFKERAELPNWIRYKTDSLHGAILIELGDCEKGSRLLNQTVERMYLDSDLHQTIKSAVFARKNQYEYSSKCI